MVTLEQARKVLSIVDQGLCKGIGNPKAGEMCVEAAVCYALGEPHGDEPSCVGAAVRWYKIGLNDANWSSNEARTKGLREIAVCQLGSKEINQVEFTKYVILEVIKQILPITLRANGLEKEAKACEDSKNLAEAKIAALGAATAANAAYYAAADAADYVVYAAYAIDAAAYVADRTINNSLKTTLTKDFVKLMLELLINFIKNN